MYPFALHSAEALNNRFVPTKEYVTSPMGSVGILVWFVLDGRLHQSPLKVRHVSLGGMTFLSHVSPSTVLANSCHILNMVFRVRGGWYFTYQLARLVTETFTSLTLVIPTNVETTITTYPRRCRRSALWHLILVSPTTAEADHWLLLRSLHHL